MNSASKPSCATRNGGSDWVSAKAFSAGAFPTRLITMWMRVNLNRLTPSTMLRVLSEAVARHDVWREKVPAIATRPLCNTLRARPRKKVDVDQSGCDNRLRETRKLYMKPTNQEGPSQGLTRREFLGTAVGTTVVSGLLPRVWAAETRNGIPYRTLGNTGENVSCIGLGGYHLGQQSDEQES